MAQLRFDTYSQKLIKYFKCENHNFVANVCQVKLQPKTSASLVIASLAALYPGPNVSDSKLKLYQVLRGRTPCHEMLYRLTRTLLKSQSMATTCLVVRMSACHLTQICAVHRLAYSQLRHLHKRQKGAYLYLCKVAGVMPLSKEQLTRLYSPSLSTSPEDCKLLYLG